jgi:hypothetical protein
MLDRGEIQDQLVAANLADQTLDRVEDGPNGVLIQEFRCLQPDDGHAAEVLPSNQWLPCLLDMVRNMDFARASGVP